MKIESIITEEEFSKVKDLDYNQFCDHATKLVKLCVEESLKVLPLIITHLSNQFGHLRELSDKFYDKNKDLVKHKKIVAQEIEQAESKNPGKSYEEILDEASKNARKIISEMDKVTDFNPKNLKHFDSHLEKL